jgi:surface antigen
MRVFSKWFAVFFTLISLQACQGGMNKQGGGTLIGGVAGGLLGSQFGKGEGKLLATGIGALAGALVGGEVGRSLDSYDKQMLEKSSHQALEFAPSGTSVQWNNPDSGHSGSVTPVRTFRSEAGKQCREYVQEVMIGGEKQKAYGKACRQQDGHWQIVE